MGKSPYKMKGHSLPGPNQKKSPTKFVFTTAAIIAAAKAAAATTLGKAAIGAGASAAIGAGAKAAAKPGQRRKAAKLEAQNKAKEASAKSTDMGELGTKSKITDNE